VQAAAVVAHPRLSIIIVSWNVRELLDRALKSVYLSAMPPLSYEVIVVDNASSDGTPERVVSKYPNVRLIANKTNLGFAAANNQGIAVARGDLLLLLNSDTEVVGDALRDLVAHIDAHPEIGLVGPRLLNGDGSTQSSRRRFPTLPILFLESTWLQGRMSKRAATRYFVTDQSENQVQEVDWVVGAAMLVRRTVVEAIGGLDEGFFMYSEELDWCRRIRAAGWKVAYIPHARVIHHGGKSSEQVAPARHIYFQASKVRYARKYHGWLVAELLRAWLLAQYGWQIVVEGAKWLVGHRRDLRASRIQAYVTVIGTGLRQPRRDSALPERTRDP